MTKRPEPNRYVMLKLFQHLFAYFLLSAGIVHPTPTGRGFSDAILNKKTTGGRAGVSQQAWGRASPGICKKICQFALTTNLSVITFV